MANQQRALEVQLLAAARQSRAIANQIAKILGDYKFSDQTSTWLWERLRHVHAKGEPVRLGSLRAMISLEAVQAHEPLMEALVEVWQASPSASPLVDCGTLKRFHQHEKLSKGMDRALKAQLAGDLDGATEMLGRIAQEARPQSDLEVTNLFDFDAWDAPNENHLGILTGIRTYDEVTLGGVNRGDLGVVFGNTNMGKSILLVNLGYAAVKHGKRVLHVDSENGIDLVKWRYIARIIRQPTNTLMRRRGKGVVGFREWAVQHHERFKDSIRFINIGVDQTPLEDLDARIFSEIGDGWEPDVILVDTPDHCVLKTETDNTGLQAQMRYAKCKSIAQRAKAVCWAVTQAKQESEGKIATNKNVAWGYAKAQLATTVITINPGLDDKGNPMSERTMGSKRSLFVAKARNAPARFVLPLHTDFATAYIVEQFDHERDVAVEAG